MKASNKDSFLKSKRNISSNACSTSSSSYFSIPNYKLKLITKSITIPKCRLQVSSKTIKLTKNFVAIIKLDFLSMSQLKLSELSNNNTAKTTPDDKLQLKAIKSSYSDESQAQLYTYNHLKEKESNDDYCKILAEYKNHDIEYSISKKDYDTLNDGVYLNDEIVNFYIDFQICERPCKTSKILNFSSLFYTKICSEILTNKSNQGKLLPCYSTKSICNWKKRHAKFDYDLWIIPINENKHWSLVVVLFPGYIANLRLDSIPSEDLPAIYYLDSLYDENTTAVDYIKRYLYEEWAKCNNLEQDSIEEFFRSSSQLFSCESLKVRNL